MLEYNFDKMLFRIPEDKHSPEEIIRLLDEHPEVKFVSTDPVLHSLRSQS